jgi:hypothetical protein
MSKPDAEGVAISGGDDAFYLGRCSHLCGNR